LILVHGSPSLPSRPSPSPPTPVSNTSSFSLCSRFNAEILDSRVARELSPIVFFPKRNFHERLTLVVAVPPLLTQRLVFIFPLSCGSLFFCPTTSATIFLYFPPFRPPYHISFLRGFFPSTYVTLRSTFFLAVQLDLFFNFSFHLSRLIRIPLKALVIWPGPLLFCFTSHFFWSVNNSSPDAAGSSGEVPTPPPPPPPPTTLWSFGGRLTMPRP